MNPDARAPRAQVQLDLELYPWAVLNREVSTMQQIELPTEQGGRWKVSAPGGRLPGPFDMDVYVAIFHLYNELPTPDGAVRFGFHELATLMGKTPGSTTYEAIELSIRTSLTNVVIEAWDQWVEGQPRAKRPARERYVKFPIIYDTQIDTIDLPNGAQAKQATLKIHPRILAALQHKQRFLDIGPYYRLSLPAAKRLYRYLDYRRWFGEDKYRIVLPASEVASRLPLARAEPKYVMRVLQAAHEELVRHRVLTAAAFESLREPGKRRPLLRIVYTFPDAPTSPVVETAPRAQLPSPPVDDALRRQGLFEDLCTLFRDRDQSGAFYTKVVNHLPDQTVRRFYSECKGIILEQGNYDLARKLFSRSCTMQLRAMGKL